MASEMTFMAICDGGADPDTIITQAMKYIDVTEIGYVTDLEKWLRTDQWRSVIDRRRGKKAGDKKTRQGSGATGGKKIGGTGHPTGATKGVDAATSDDGADRLKLFREFTTKHEHQVGTLPWSMARNSSHLKHLRPKLKRLSKLSTISNEMWCNAPWNWRRRCLRPTQKTVQILCWDIWGCSKELLKTSGPGLLAMCPRRQRRGHAPLCPTTMAMLMIPTMEMTRGSGHPLQPPQAGAP